MGSEFILLYALFYFIFNHYLYLILTFKKILLFLINEIDMCTLYGQYFCLLVIMVKLYSVSLKLRGNSEPPLLYDVKLNFNIPSRTISSYKLSHQNSDSNSKKSRLLGGGKYM